jgi:hypothetical protein
MSLTLVITLKYFVLLPHFCYGVVHLNTAQCVQTFCPLKKNPISYSSCKQHIFIQRKDP